MPAWPGTLPTSPTKFSSLSSPDCLINTEVTTGPPKVRRRTTAAETPWRMQWVLTTAQKNTWKTFWQTTLYHGSLSFTMTDPETGSSASFRIMSWTLEREADVWQLDADVRKLA